MSDHKYKYCMY